MKQMFWLAIALFFTFSSALAQENPEKMNLEWHLRDLYFYDKDDTMVKLELASKLLVRFSRKLTAKESVSFFDEISPTAQQPEVGDPLSIVVSFDNSITPLALLDIANKINRSSLAIAFPVFLVENVEAVIEGIAVEPKIILTAERLFERMKQYGSFSSRKTVYENRAWVFSTDEVRPPLNLLVFTNLVKNDAWVRRAYPHFRFLHDPIIASIVVEPVSGTVSEMRTLIFTIKIFDPEIVLLENELPEFGNGLFMPVQGILANPSNIKRPPGYLFESTGEPIKSLAKNGNRSRTYVISRKFKFYALGEWIMHPQPVSYTKKGIIKEIKSSGFTLIVNSQIGNLVISDMPRPMSLPYYPMKSPMFTLETTLPQIPSYWFDAWMFRKDYKVIQSFKLASVFLGVLGAAIILSAAIFTIRETCRKTTSRRLLADEIGKVIGNAKDHKSYADYYEALSRILTGVMPYFSSHSDWREVEENKTFLEVFNATELEFVRQLFIELNRRHMKDFEPQADNLAKVDKDIRVIFERARQHFSVAPEKD